MRSTSERDLSCSAAASWPQPAIAVSASTPSRSACFISEDVSPFAPPHVIASAVEMLAGEIARFPGVDRTRDHRSNPKALLAVASGAAAEGVVAVGLVIGGSGA